MSADKVVTVTTRRGITGGVRMWSGPGGDAAPVVFLHGATGLLADEPLLDALAEGHAVYAPVWPGYGDEPGEELLEDMLDFALHGFDLVDALAEGGAPAAPILIGHSMGAMIAAEMACLAPAAFARLVLLDPLGVWIDDHPVPDLFVLLPYEFADLLFADPARGAALLTGGVDFNDPKATEAFLVANARRLGTAGKILFPVPNRRLSKRAYRITTPTQILWGAADRLVPPEHYAAAWEALLPHARTVVVDGAGHMLPHEQPSAAAAAIDAVHA